jgi:hypothetical protein
MLRQPEAAAMLKQPEAAAMLEQPEAGRASTAASPLTGHGVALL